MSAKKLTRRRIVELVGGGASLTLSTGNGGASMPLSNTLVVEGTGKPVRTSYRFDVTGDLKRSRELGSLDGADAAAGASAEGAVWGDGVDGYRYSGRIVDMAVDGPAKVYRNGQLLDPTTLSSDAAASHTVQVRGSGEKVTTTYSITVSDDIRRSALLGSLDGADSIGETSSERSAEGAVWGDGVDGYRFAGEITDLTVDGPADLVVDGRRVDPDEMSGGGDSPEFSPDVDVYCYYVSVAADRLRTVRLRMGDGSTVEFEGNYDGGANFGYEGAGALTPGSDTTFSEFHRAIERVDVSDGTTVRTFENDSFPCHGVSFGYSTVTCENEAGADVRTTYADGTVKQYDATYDAPHTYGSPGRRLVRADFVARDVSIVNPSEADAPRSERAVTFDGDAVTVGPEEFVDVTPRFEEAELEFVDGTRQPFTGSRGENSFSAPETFRGTGENEGKAVERLHLFRAEGAPKTVYFRFDHPDAA